MGNVIAKGPSLLSSLLAREKLTYAAFARLVGADRARIQRCARGKRKPGIELALSIEEKTGGRIPASSWVGELVERPAPKGKHPRGARRAVSSPAA